MTYIYDPSSISVSTKMQILNSVFAGMNQRMSGKPPFIRSAETSILTKKYRFIEFFIPGIIAMAVMTASLFGTVNVNTELRQKGIIRKLSTTPITRTDWILSNILYQFILAVMSTIAMLLVSYAVFNVSLQINAWLPVFIVLDVFAFVGIGMILTRFVKEAESAAAAANAIMFPMMFLSGSFFPIEMMPGFLQTFARILPLYYVNEGLRASMVFVDNMAALRYAAIIGVFAAVVFILGIMAAKLEESDMKKHNGGLVVFAVTAVSFSFVGCAKQNEKKPDSAPAARKPLPRQKKLSRCSLSSGARTPTSCITTPGSPPTANWIPMNR